MEPLWTPSAERLARARLGRFMAEARTTWGIDAPDYAALHAWSVAEPAQFWRSMWDFAGVIGDGPGARIVIDGDRMPGARWFPDARLNYAENLLRRRDEADALVFWGEERVRRRVSFADLYDQVSRMAQALAARGVCRGDRVAGYLPNMPETIVAALATASLGAIWSSCSSDFGTRGVLDRFGQIEPRVLIAADGYFYNGKTFNRRPQVREILAELPTVEHVIVVPYAEERPLLDGIWGAAHYGDALGEQPGGPIAFVRVPFDHPLVIMFSSGTTGAPKCIVHGTGGTLLQHMKEHALQSDIGRGDRVFYATTCGWMMWNWLVSALASEATLLLYDGAPFHPDGNVLFDYADAEGMTLFGTSAKYLDAAAKAGLEPKRSHDLGTLRTMTSTGSPLAPEGFDYVYRAIKDDLHLASISGGTDIISCFALGNPMGPVRRGELQAFGLGMAVDVFDDAGAPLRGEPGELVCTRPFPSMPVSFWNDPDGAKYRAAYFERFEGVWCHGDWVMRTEHDGLVIYGRSDAVLNPGGVRIGTAEIYRQVEQFDEVLEAICIGQDWEGGPAHRAVRPPPRRRCARRRARRQDQGAHPPRVHAAPRAGEGDPDRRHSAHALRQDHRACGARRDPRPRDQEQRGAGEPRGPGALRGPSGPAVLERFRFTRKRSDSLSLTAVGRRALARACWRDGQRLREGAAYAAGRGRGLSRVRAGRTRSGNSWRSRAGKRDPDHGAVHGGRRVRQHCAMNRPQPLTSAPAPRASALEKNASAVARATLRARGMASVPTTHWVRTIFQADAARRPGPIRTDSVSLCLTLSRYISLCLTSRLALSHLASRYIPP